jgi:3-hydroxyisobutyrate dehydrogenase
MGMAKGIRAIECEAREPAGERDVAVIGLGQMGRGIARNLDRAGRLAAAWDTSPEAMQQAGLSPAVARAEPGTLGGVKAVLFVVPGVAEIRAVLDDGGLLSAPHQGQVLVDLTTSDPAATRAIAAQARETGRDYLDCGMTGGAKAADAGTITLMVGGDRAVVEACRPLLRHIAGKVFHVGDSGAGHAMKLIHNMICHTIFLATSEGCRLAETLGIPLETAIAVINAGNARSFVSEQRFPNHIIPGTFDGRSRTANLAKDLAMAADLARQAGQPGAYSALAARLLGRAMQQGLGEEDFTRLYEHLTALMPPDAEDL